MVFVACGLNHKTASLAMREKFACPLEQQPILLTRLLHTSLVEEAAMLSTCNRTEFYCEMIDPENLLHWLSDEYKICTTELSPYLYIHPDQHGIRHTLRVASGLDSMMLGEPQIFGQLKQAYQLACESGTIKNKLRDTFEYIFSASKRIRSQSGIGRNPVSIAYAAVRLIGQLFKSIEALTVFLIGSGETAALVADYLQKAGVQQFLIASRTVENAARLALKFNGKTLTIADIPTYLAEADIVISATACPFPFINQGLVLDALTKRSQKPMFFLDLAVPRDIEPNVAALSNVALYNIDDLRLITEQGMDERKNAALEAETLINAELDNYIRWHRTLRARDVICDYRYQMRLLADAELKRAQNKLAAGLESEAVLEEFSERLLNKLIHTQTIGFKQAASDDREDLLDLARHLFVQKTNMQAFKPIEEDSYEEIT